MKSSYEYTEPEWVLKHRIIFLNWAAQEAMRTWDIVKANEIIEQCKYISNLWRLTWLN